MKKLFLVLFFSASLFAEDIYLQCDFTYRCNEFSNRLVINEEEKKIVVNDVWVHTPWGTENNDLLGYDLGCFKPFDDYENTLCYERHSVVNIEEDEITFMDVISLLREECQYKNNQLSDMEFKERLDFYDQCQLTEEHWMKFSNIKEVLSKVKIDRITGEYFMDGLYKYEFTFHEGGGISKTQTLGKTSPYPLWEGKGKCTKKERLF